MRAVLHLCAIVLALPQLVFATIFLLLDHLTAGGTLGSVFTRALDLLDFVFTWGGLAVLAGLLVLIGAGFSTRWRPFAAAVVATLVVASATTLILVVGVDDVLIFLPGLISLGVSVWLMWPVRVAGS
jgi:hypothetical protein